MALRQGSRLLLARLARLPSGMPSTQCTLCACACSAINGTAAASVSGRTALEPLQPLAQRRGFAAGADNEPKKAESEAAAAGGGKPEASTSQQEGIAGENETEEEKNIDELQVALAEKEQVIGKMKAEMEKLTDGFKRALAEMENLRQRHGREMESTRKFAVQGFVKPLLDVADNLQRAIEVVPAEAVPEDPAQAPASVDREKALKLLASLHKGVTMTEKILAQAFKSQGLEAFDPVGEKFNPELHNALFDVPDPSKKPGTVAVVTKRGYKLHDRVLRAADVGVVKAPENGGPAADTQ